MYANRAIELLKTLERKEKLPPFEEDMLRQVYSEMNFLSDQNEKDVQAYEDRGTEYSMATLILRHASLTRNQQCVLSYVYNRIMKIQNSRWTKGAVLPPALKQNMTEQETQFFLGYNKILGNYMRSIGDGMGMELTVGAFPPKDVMRQVKVLSDYEFEEGGKSYNLLKESLMLLPTQLIGKLVREGIAEVVE